MKNTLYLVLLVTMFSLSSGFATEQLEEKLNKMNESGSIFNEIEKFEKKLNQRIDINESLSSRNESGNIKKKLEQWIVNNVNSITEDLSV